VKIEMAYVRKNNARLTAVTKDETKAFITDQLQKEGENISNFMLTAALDRLMGFEEDRTKAAVLDFKDLLLGWLNSKGKLDEDLVTEINVLYFSFAQKMLPDLLKKNQKPYKTAIESYLFDNALPKNDPEKHEIENSFDRILSRINEDQAQEERSIYTNV
jgi:hypothetical protein